MRKMENKFQKKINIENIKKEGVPINIHHILERLKNITYAEVVYDDGKKVIIKSKFGITIME